MKMRTTKRVTSYDEGCGLATSELTLRQHTRSSVFSDLVKNGFNNIDLKLNQLLPHSKHTGKERKIKRNMRLN